MQNIAPFPQHAAGSSKATTASSLWLPVSRQVTSESTSAPPEYSWHSSYTSIQFIWKKYHPSVHKAHKKYPLPPCESQHGHSTTRV